MESLFGSVFARPTTLRALRDAGVLLSEAPDEEAARRVQCSIVPDDRDGRGPRVHVGFAVEVQRAGGAWENIMADLPSGAADNENMARVQRVFGATDEEAEEMVRQARQAAAAAREDADDGSGTACSRNSN